MDEMRDRVESMIEWEVEVCAAEMLDRGSGKWCKYEMVFGMIWIADIGDNVLHNFDFTTQTEQYYYHQLNH